MLKIKRGLVINAMFTETVDKIYNCPSRDYKAVQNTIAFMKELGAIVTETTEMQKKLILAHGGEEKNGGATIKADAKGYGDFVKEFEKMREQEVVIEANSMQVPKELAFSPLQVEMLGDLVTYESK